jgi:hypothetical protein
MIRGQGRNSATFSTESINPKILKLNSKIKNMKTKIGARYQENLARIKQVVNATLRGSFQETEEILIEVGEFGRCYYDRCFNKKIKSGARVIILNSETGRGSRVCQAEGYAFHTECLEALRSDRRFANSN